MDSINNEVIQLNREIKKIISHSILMQFIDQPNINEDMIAILVKILRDANVDQKLVPHYIVAIMLMQIALNTHEEVSNTEETENAAQLRHRQLSILAGDYYSSMYYHILAKTEDIEFITIMSKGVQEINEAKVHLYMDKEADEDSLVMYLCGIETILVKKTAEYFHFTEQRDLFIDFLLYKRLLAELENYRHNRTSNFIHALQSIHTVENETDDRQSDLLKHAITKVGERVALSLTKFDPLDEVGKRIEESLATLKI